MWFKASFGMSPHAWVMQPRLAHARRLLADARLSLPQVAARAGYAHPSHPSHLNAALRSAGLDSAARYRQAALAQAREAESPSLMPPREAQPTPLR
jgi:transcriptional regulator GlxA family with amidase domain